MSAVLSPGEIRALKLEELMLLEEQERRFLGNRLSRYRPYPKQREFHAAGRTHRERLLKAGNQLGKTLSAANETAMHLCGRYPDWWQGRTWDRPVSAWAAGVTNEVTRDSLQLLLLGKFGDFGTGTIPRDALKEWNVRRGLADAVESLIVRHGGGGDVQAGESVLGIKSYDQGRERFQASTLDFVWLDEEPDVEDYTEFLTRTNATKGMVYMTFTPLKGMTGTVKRFLIDQAPGTHVTTMTIHDAAHYTPEEREAIIASYPAHEREARVNGTPTLGSGRIFPVVRESITVEPFPIPAHWARIGGMDFGWDHPAAAVELAWDRETDVVFVTKAVRQKQITPLLFSAQLLPWGTWLPWAWPSDGLQQTFSNAGRAIRDQFEDHGLNMLPKHATNPPESGEEEGSGGNGVDAGLLDMLDRMQTGRWKVFSNLLDWFSEFEMYHRKDGKIVKVDDDLMDGSRYANMMKRHAITRPAPMGAIKYKDRMVRR
jgi:phage terminase large subunit-like protein